MYTKVEQLTVVPNYANIGAAATCIGTSMAALAQMQPGETLNLYPIDTLHIEVTCGAPQKGFPSPLWNNYTVNGVPVGNQHGLFTVVMQMIINSVIYVHEHDDLPAHRSLTTEVPTMSVVEITIRD